MYFRRFFAEIMVPKILLPVSRPNRYVLRLEVDFFFFKVRCSDLPHMLLNPNGILFFTIQFAFNSPMGKSEHLKGF